MANYVKLGLLNEHFQCGICQGYIIDATTITECFHSFCKSCIFHFVESIDHSCPTCNENLDDLDNCIASDPSLQRLIYQLIPNLLDNELERREKFSETNESISIINQNTLLNLKLCCKLKQDKRKNAIKNSNSISKSGETDSKELAENGLPNEEIIPPKYIQCIAVTPLRIISRMIRNKYNIPENYGIKVYHMHHKLSEKETLLQIYTSFIKSKTDVLELKYELVKRKLRPSDLATENKKIIKSMSEAFDIEDNNTNSKRNNSAKGKKANSSTIKETKLKNGVSRKNEVNKSKVSIEKELISESSIKYKQRDVDESGSGYYSDCGDGNLSERKQKT